MTDVELYQAVTACREALRDAVAQIYEATDAALRIAGGNVEIVRMAHEAELACNRAREEIDQAA